jgi:hypothetical protein
VVVGSKLLPPVPVRELHGFAYVESSAGAQPTALQGRSKQLAPPKPGLVATEPGSVAVIAFEHEDLSDAPFAALEYLRSYEHMGRASVECRADCACAQATIDTHDEAHRTSEHVSLTIALAPFGDGGDGGGGVRVVARDGEPAVCELVVTVLNATSSGEHKMKLTGLVLGGSRQLGSWSTALRRADQRRRRRLQAVRWRP